jgi:ethanolamine utilization protein EutA
VQSEILCIDGVVLWDFDYIDLGRIRLPSMTVPVTIKSLVFSEDPRLPRGQKHLNHHHDHGHSHDHAHDHDQGHSHDRHHRHDNR